MIDIGQPLKNLCLHWSMALTTLPQFLQHQMWFIVLKTQKC